MSFPFGGHPTLKDFLEAAIEAGCKVESIVRSRRTNGAPFEVIQVTNVASSACLSIAQPDLAERLAPSMVAHYQRRLGIKTRFPALDDPPA